MRWTSKHPTATSSRAQDDSNSETKRFAGSRPTGPEIRLDARVRLPSRPRQQQIGQPGQPRQIANFL